MSAFACRQPECVGVHRDHRLVAAGVLIDDVLSDVVADDASGAAAVLAAASAQGERLRITNVPEGCPTAALLDELGAPMTIQQLEMRLIV